MRDVVKPDPAFYAGNLRVLGPFPITYDIPGYAIQRQFDSLVIDASDGTYVLVLDGIETDPLQWDSTFEIGDALSAINNSISLQGSFPEFSLEYGDLESHVLTVINDTNGSVEVSTTTPHDSGEGIVLWTPDVGDLIYNVFAIVREEFSSAALVGTFLNGGLGTPLAANGYNGELNVNSVTNLSGDLTAQDSNADLQFQSITQDGYPLNAIMLNPVPICIKSDNPEPTQGDMDVYVMVATPVLPS